ncbi:hypothetical protein Tco_1082805 [Tanacetum coccineum]|uniref:Uncharacterized protein n=1 Tax=Tanacetum coccineum TaxID=301880 RepID=A0ABQ5I2X3_9ASTR
MIQPKPEDLPKDNPKLEISVLRSKERRPSHTTQGRNRSIHMLSESNLIADIENDNMDPTEIEYYKSIHNEMEILLELGIKQASWLVPLCLMRIFTFEPLTLSLTSMPSCDLESLTNILILCLILKASDQSLRKSLSLNLELS